jgi:hypothetical protein
LISCFAHCQVFAGESAFEKKYATRLLQGDDVDATFDPTAAPTPVSNNATFTPSSNETMRTLAPSFDDFNSTLAPSMNQTEEITAAPSTNQTDEFTSPPSVANSSTIDTPTMEATVAPSRLPTRFPTSSPTNSTIISTQSPTIDALHAQQVATVRSGVTVLLIGMILTLITGVTHATYIYRTTDTRFSHRHTRLGSTGSDDDFAALADHLRSSSDGYEPPPRVSQVEMMGRGRDSGRFV